LRYLAFLLRSTVQDKHIHRLSLCKRLLLFFIKMKLDLPYVELSILFGISSQTCKAVFVDVTTGLSPILKTYYSNYKGTTTIKFMTGVSPGGTNYNF
jgi:predicted transcriptional regulator